MTHPSETQGKDAASVTVHQKQRFSHVYCILLEFGGYSLFETQDIFHEDIVTVNT